MRGESPPLLGEVGRREARDGRIGAVLGVERLRLGIGAEVGPVPRQVHLRVVAALPLGEEIEERNPRPVIDRGVRGDPLLGIRPVRIQLHRFEEIPRPLGVDLVQPAEAVRLPVAAGDVLARQDHHEATAVGPDEGLIEDAAPRLEVRADGHELLRQLEVVAGLAFVDAIT